MYTSVTKYVKKILSLYLNISGGCLWTVELLDIYISFWKKKWPVLYLLLLSGEKHLKNKRTQ